MAKLDFQSIEERLAENEYREYIAVLYDEIIRNKDEILHDFEDAFARYSKYHKAIKFLLAHIGCHVSEVYSKENVEIDTLRTVNYAVSDWIRNVAPDGVLFFILTLTDLKAQQIEQLYNTIPPELVPFFEGKRITPITFEEAKQRGNAILYFCSNRIYKSIVKSRTFYENLQNLIKYAMVSEGNLYITDGTDRDTVYRLIDPFSIASSFNSFGEKTGVWRRLIVEKRDFERFYPDRIRQPSGADTLKPWDTLQLKECIVLRYVQSLGVATWLYILFDYNNECILVRPLTQNPCITLVEKRDPQTNVGIGRLIHLYHSIIRANEQERTVNLSVDYLAAPAYTYNKDCLDESEFNRRSRMRRGEQDGDGDNGAVFTIKPNALIPVKSHDLIARIPPPDPTLLLQERQRNKDIISAVIRGQQVTTDPNATATQVNAQIAESAAFLATNQGNTIREFMEQNVKCQYHILNRRGVIFEEIKSYLLKPSKSSFLLLPPYFEHLNDIFTQAGRPELFNQYIDFFVSNFIRIINDLDEGVNIECIAPVGSQKDLSELRTTIEGLQIIMQTMNLPSDEILDLEKFISYVAGKTSMNKDVLLTEKERNEIIKAKREMATQVAASQQATT